MATHDRCYKAAMKHVLNTEGWIEDLRELEEKGAKVYRSWNPGIFKVPPTTWSAHYVHATCTPVHSCKTRIEWANEKRSEGFDPKTWKPKQFKQNTLDFDRFTRIVGFIKNGQLTMEEGHILLSR